MLRQMMRVAKWTAFLLLLLVAVFAALLFSGIIWRSPAYYHVKEEKEFAVTIMDMKAYDTLGNHPRPYIYQLQQGQGAVYVLGIEHTRDENNPQIDSIQRIWHQFNPDVALVEGRLGFLFSGLQNPVALYGEGGEAVMLAKKNHVPFYTWEPEKSAEINLLLKKYSAVQLALFYSLRPYFSDFRFGKPADPDKKMIEYIQSRTDHDGIRGVITSVTQLDSIWKKDFPGEKDWRNTSDEYGWPAGYLADIAALSNITRDIHMCSIITELVQQGKKVLITMGSSHAFRIENTLRNALTPLSHN